MLVAKVEAFLKGSPLVLDLVMGTAQKEATKDASCDLYVLISWLSPSLPFINQCLMGWFIHLTRVSNILRSAWCHANITGMKGLDYVCTQVRSRF